MTIAIDGMAKAASTLELDDDNSVDVHASPQAPSQAPIHSEQASAGDTPGECVTSQQSSASPDQTTTVPRPSSSSRAATWDKVTILSPILEATAESTAPQASVPYQDQDNDILGDRLVHQPAHEHAPIATSAAQSTPVLAFLPSTSFPVASPSTVDTPPVELTAEGVSV